MHELKAVLGEAERLIAEHDKRIGIALIKGLDTIDLEDRAQHACGRRTNEIAVRGTYAKGFRGAHAFVICQAPRCPFRKSDPDIMMVESAEDRQRENAPDSLDWSRFG
ncbi:MAG: hypothetical protein NVSMB62_25240 [Acidobacteriaceae bacterium]